MSFLKPSSIKDLFIHIGIILAIIIVTTLVIFYVWLPGVTNHGETITVPDVQGMTVNELRDFLGKRDLRFEVTKDSSYVADAKPLSVLRQVPAPNAKVKENRKIYVTLNSETPPKVRMPKVEDLSLKSALMTLRTYDLKFGEAKYVPDEFFVVHEAQIKGRTLLEGEKIDKGSTVDLVVGNGFGNTVFQSPLLLGLDLEEAETVILGSGLEIGAVRTVEIGTAAFTEGDTTILRPISPGSIQKQEPAPGVKLEIGDIVSLWIFQPDSLGTGNSQNLLDD
ncbi:MAG: PASTA domain-containing protein [Bacteroidota bacterium]